MRHYTLHTFVLIALLALLAGCSKSEGNGGLSDEYINLASRIAVSDDQLSENNFTPGERIGLFVVPYVNGNPGTVDGSNYVSNAEFTYTGLGWQYADGDRLPWPGNSTLDLYAYYPYDPDLNDPTSYTFRVNSDQSTLSGYDGSDFLLAVTEGITPRSSVPLIFYHKLSRINVNVDADLADESSAASLEVEIFDLFPTATLDLGTGSVTVVTTGDKINLLPYYTEMDDEEYSDCFCVIVPPQIIPSGTRLLRIGIDGTDYFYRTTQNLTLEEGSTLSFNIAVTQLGISVSVDQINQWIEGGTVEGNIGNRAPRVLDVSEIDWNTSLVQDIYYRNTLIGQVCREYLFLRDGSIDAQAIVVYPLGTDGTPNLSAGFVAQLMNRDRNSNTNEYETNPASVHGGRAAFGTTNNLASYIAGTSAPIELVQIVSSDEATAAESTAVVILEVRPHYLTDIDGNDYSIVKIGTQYWTAENVKMERYSDGTPLEVFWYQNDISYKEPYGGYYTFATTTDPRGIAPQGWRVPYGDDYTTLHAYIEPNAGAKLKATSLWNNLENADNVTGFNGLPLGRRSASGVYEEFRNYGQWWSQTSANANDAFRIYLTSGSAAITYATVNKNYTQNIRFLRE